MAFCNLSSFCEVCQHMLSHRFAIKSHLFILQILYVVGNELFQFLHLFWIPLECGDVVPTLLFVCSFAQCSSSLKIEVQLAWRIKAVENWKRECLHAFLLSVIYLSADSTQEFNGLLQHSARVNCMWVCGSAFSAMNASMRYHFHVHCMMFAFPHRTMAGLHAFVCIMPAFCWSWAITLIWHIWVANPHAQCHGFIWHARWNKVWRTYRCNLDSARKWRSN